MLRFDIALEALKRRLAAAPARKARPASDAPPAGVLIPFPLRRPTAEPSPAGKRRIGG
jgi:hypothetical protein